ncbi:MAG: hypothetical protein VX241_03475 [Pseudomonadota bacterium]|nr:hypothetical protein [Pseudomonadota bacterium]MEE3294395.1 hypothetical protein [Pseudomonadota bacterium]
MITTPIILGISYAVLFALLLSFNFFTRFSFLFKMFLVFGSLIFFIISYKAIEDLQGRPYKDEDILTNKKSFQLLWHQTEEPNKINNTEGAIFILIQMMNEGGLILSKPRLLEIPYDPLINEKLDDAMEKVKKGTPITARFTYLDLKQNEGEEIIQIDKNFDIYNSLQGEINLEFNEIPKPSLPPK